MPLASNIVVFALLNLNLIVLLLLVLLLFRNLVKLWFERRQGVLGAKFKAKLVLAFLTLSLIPSMLIFLIASNFITKSIEGFQAAGRAPARSGAGGRADLLREPRADGAPSRPAHRPRDRCDALLTETRREALATYLVEQQDRLGISSITIFGTQGQELVHVKDPILGDLRPGTSTRSQLRRPCPVEAHHGARARVRRPRRGGGRSGRRKARAASASSSSAHT